MKAVNGAQMGQIDKYCIEKLGIPGMILMENAALKIVQHVIEYIGVCPSAAGRVIFIAGKGNNAGDAFAAARHLLVRGFDIIIYCLFDKSLLTGDAGLNFDIVQRLGANIRYINEETDFAEFAEASEKASIIVDGIFGTGFKGEIKGYIADIIKIINQRSKYTLSIDIPSGVEAATGKVSSCCIEADETVTFELPKIGQLVYPGAEFSGKLIIEGIGMPSEAIENLNTDTFLIDSQIVKSIIPKRKADFNKGSCGKVAVVTGSHGMAGSGCLTSKSALRTGSGLVYIAAPKSLINVYQSVVPEAVGKGLPEREGILAEDSADVISDLIKKCDAAAIGPGLSANECIYYIIGSIAEKIEVPVVLDADALNALSKDIGLFKKFKGDVVITPHPGEMSRLTGLTIDHIQENRLEVARKYSRLWGVTVVLKGAKTVVADSGGRLYINPTGNSGMATAGSGDSLTGIIVSLMGQGAGAFEAAVAGVFLHGLAGDIAAQKHGEHGMTATDIAESIPQAIIKVTENQAFCLEKTV